MKTWSRLFDLVVLTLALTEAASWQDTLGRYLGRK